MRIVTVRHRDARGKTDYTIYESPEQLLKDIPEAKISYSLEEAKKGDYVLSENGWVVPLYNIAYLEDKYQRGTGRRRKKTYKYRVYHFPKFRKCVPIEKLDRAVFNYVPAKSSNISSENKRNRMYELAPRKIFWAQHVVAGHSPEMATALVYPRVPTKNSLTKKLLLNEKVMDYIFSRQGNSMKRALEKEGITGEFMSRLFMNILQNKNENVKMRLMAMDVLWNWVTREE